VSNSLYNGGFSQKQLVNELQGNSTTLRDLTAADLDDFNTSSTSSFRFDPPGTGLKSTQQLPLDWSKFENHTFFNSAQAKTNVAFETIFNSFPFDGTKAEIDQFIDSLTGFEKYVYDSIPKNNGYINFDGSNHVSVIDSAGAELPEMSKDTTGVSKIDPGLSSMTIEMQLYVSPTSNNNQIVLQKISAPSDGFTLAISQSASTSTCNLDFYVSSGSYYLTSSAQINKGQFSSVAAQFNRSPGVDRLYLYLDGTLVSSSSLSSYIGRINFSSSPMTIGSGSMHLVTPSYSFVPGSRFSGSMDDLRIYHRNRTQNEISSSMRDTVYPESDLKLHYRFNEPTGSYTNNSVVIDHSGNGLHTSVVNFSTTQRIPHASVPLTYEKVDYSPILFPDNSYVSALNSELLLSASQYDGNNPNLITKLIPQHYLTREQDFYVLDSIEGEVGVGIDEENSLPRKTKLGSIQLISSLLYVWAKQFDEVKCFIDHFSKIRSTDYNDEGTASDQMLPFIAKYFGIDLPNMFRNVEPIKFTTGESTRPEIAALEASFQAVQNTIWRRILHELPFVLRSKGTLHAVKSLIRSAGIEPDSILKFKEYGGTKSGFILPNRSKRSVVQGMLNFSGSLFDGAVSYDSNTGVPNSLPFISSAFLSASRVEPGDPVATGTVSDGLFTSGSWSYEALYKFDPSYNHSTAQSLARLHVTGTSSPSSKHGVIANLVLTAGTNTSSLDLYVGTATGASNSYTKISLTGSNIFDGGTWHVSFGRSSSMTDVSSSYYVWAARQNPGVSDYLHVTGDYLDKGSVVDTISAYNTSGAFLCVGPQSLFEGGSRLLNDANVPDSARESMFTGKVSRIRFWTKSLTTNELLEHARNVESVGVEAPSLNYNFVSSLSGSWEKLRIDAACTQEVTESAASGGIKLFDYSQNEFHLTGSGFESSKRVIENERVQSSVISMQFDEAQTDNKIRVRSYLNYENVESSGGDVAPLYETVRSEVPVDDLRFSIEVSATRILDEDIAKIFAALDEIDDAVGAAELQFSPDYPKLDALRDVYFNRLTEKVKMKQLYEFFRWFDTSMGALIEKFVPGNTRFLGSNYVIEPHSLERSKFYYLQSGIYLGENDRRGLKGTIKLGQVVATVRRM
jgi:hypothetical protein